MSHFSNLFTDAVAAAGLSLRELEKITGLDHSALSRLMSGDVAPSETSLVKLVTKFQPGTAVGRELLFAFFRDTAGAVGVPADKLRLSLADEPAPIWERMPPQLRETLELLAAEGTANADFAAMLQDWAAIVRRHQADLEKKVYPFPQDKGKKVAEPKGKWPGAGNGKSQAPTA